jgi:hypothetical protein
MYTIRIEITDDVHDEYSSSIAVEHRLREHRRDAIKDGKTALRAALSLVWDESVFPEFGGVE